MKKFFLSLIIVLFVFGPVAATVPLAHAQTSPYQNYEDRIGECFTINGGIDVGSCFAWIMYFFAWFSSKFAELAAGLMDYFLAYSLDSGSYAGANNQFVEMGWSIIRDIANIFFIFTLLYIAIRHILQLGGDTKKHLVSLIIAALLINFSLFFTKVIIDGSNVLARAFYNNIEVENDDNIDHKTISAALVAQVNPQTLLSSDLFKPVNAPGRLPQETDVAWLVTIFGVATFVNVSMGLVFISTFLLFAARVIGLWFMMIFSPLAFASRAIPGAEGMLGEFGWSGWIKSTLKLAFMAPIFVFFLFLLTMFLGIFFSSLTPVVEQSTMQRIMSVIIPFIAIVVILNKAKDTAKLMSGTFGEAVLSGFKTAATYAVGAAGLGLAGTAMVARATAGRAASTLAGNDTVNKWMSSKSASTNRFAKGFSNFARKTVKDGTKAVSNASFDARGTLAARRTTQLLSGTLAAAGLGGGKLDLGSATTRGGYTQRMEAFQKEKEKKKDEVRVSDSDVITVPHPNDPNNRNVDIKMSLIEAETEFLRVQNKAKRDISSKNLTYIDGNGLPVLETKNQDYDAWVKDKEKAEKAKTEANTAYANAQRNAPKDANGAIDQRDPDLIDAKKKLDETTNKQKAISDLIKNGFESQWDTQEKIFKAVKRGQATMDTEAIRDLADKTKSGGVSWIYDVATGRASAKDAAAAELYRSAEKEEKKAQAEAKKDDKK